jgi:carboxyl-terminal processing protease
MRLLFLLLALAAILTAQTDPAPLAEHIKRFTQVFALVEENAADPISVEAALLDGAIPSMLRRLDPHSIFFNKDQFAQLKDMETSTRKGFGTIVSILPGRVIILQTMDGSPSARVGLNPGDEIIAINGIALSRFDNEQMIEFLTYSRQKDATLAIRRQNFPRPLEFLMSPQTMDAPTVERAFFLQPGVAYIRIGSFEEKTGKDLRAAIESLGGRKLKGLVLDLRNNPGGTFSSALESAALFLPPGTRITSVRGRAKEEQSLDVPPAPAVGDPGPYQFPLAVLMNEKSASGSEVVASALQDHGRAKIVGLPSYGKGLVQSVYPLGPKDKQDSGLALTTAYYYTPKGRSIQRRLQDAQISPDLNTAKAGVQPDFVLETETGSRLKAFLDSSGVFTAFATEWKQRHSAPDPSQDLPLVTLDEFQKWLAARNVNPSLQEWSVDRDWTRNRLQQEITNLMVSVAKGDEVEARRDRQIQRALTLINVP